MKKTFVITVEYPDNDVIPSDEVMEVTQECIEQHMERNFGANIMDGDYGRIKVKEVTDGFELVKRMREAQEELDVFEYEHDFFEYEVIMKRRELTSKVIKLESEVDEYLKKIESIDRRKALEAENTEFDYGHNVKHLSED